MTRTPVTRYRIVRDERTEDHEGRDGRIRQRHIITWDVVDTERCALVDTHRTRREAMRHLAQLVGSKLHQD